MQSRTPASSAVTNPSGIGIELLASHSLGGHAIAVVDSDDDNRELYEAWLAWSGARPASYSGGMDALNGIGCDRPDAVIVSVRLRHEDGFAVCEALQHGPGTADIPLIALTTTLNDQERAIRSGMFSAVVMIPCTCEALMALTTRALRPPHRRLAA